MNRFSASASSRKDYSGAGTMLLKPGLLLFAFIIGVALPVYGSELDDLLSGFDTEEETAKDAGLDDLLQGFDDQQTTEQTTAAAQPPSLQRWLDIRGSLSLRSAINVAQDAPPPGAPDYRGLSMFRGLGELVGDISYGSWKGRISGTGFYDGAYHLNDQRDLYTDAYLDEYEWEVELGETYVQGDLADSLDLKIGRQIVVWGKSDNLRVTDVLNPLDMRWPGMTDIRYLRLPVTMTKLDYYLGDWSSSFIVVHEPRFAKTPVYNGEFYPGTRPLPQLREPGWSWENQQLAAAVNGIFSGWDMSFYGAWIFPENYYLDQNPSGSLYRTYNKALLAGMAGNVALGNWLLKAEAAYWDDLRYPFTQEEKSRFDVLAGIEYSGFSETTIAFEVVNRHIFDYDPYPSGQPNPLKQDTTQYAFRFVRDFIHDTLHLTIVLSSYGFFAADGGYERAQLAYDLNDQVELTGGVILYESGDTPGLSGVGDNDAVFVEVKYSF